MEYYTFLNDYERRLVYHDSIYSNMNEDDAKFLWKYMAGLWFYGDRFRNISPNKNTNTPIYWWTEKSFQRIRYIIYKLENPTVFDLIGGEPLGNNKLGDPQFFDVNRWLVDNISLRFGTVSVARRFVSSVINWSNEMAKRSTPLTNEEILQTNNSISRTPPRIVDVIRATTKQGGLCFLTKFAVEISYFNGREELKLVGGELIPSPTIFQSMIDFVPKDYAKNIFDEITSVFTELPNFSMLDYYDITTSFGSNDIKEDWIMGLNLTDTITDAYSEYLEKMDEFLKTTYTIYNTSGNREDKINLTKSEIKRLNGTIGNIAYNSKYLVWGFKYGLHYIHHHVEHIYEHFANEVANELNAGRLPIDDPKFIRFEKLKNLEELLAKTSSFVINTYRGYAIIKSLTTDGLAAKFLGSGTPAARSLEFIMGLIISISPAGRFANIYVALTLGYELYKFIKSEIKESELEKKRQFARLNGLAPDPYAKYGVEIDMSQFGQIGNIAIHELLKKYKENEYSERLYRIDENRGVFQSFNTRLTGENTRDSVVLQTDYDWYYNVAVSNPNRPILDISDREGINWSRSYSYSISPQRFGVVTALAPFPKITYRQPIEFYPTITVMDLNGAINDTIEQDGGRLPRGASDPNRRNMGTGTTFEEAVAEPTERYNPGDIPDLFGAGWTTADPDWLAAAERSIQRGNGSREDLDHILSFNKFVEEVSKPRFVAQRDVSQQGPRTPTIEINYNLIDEANYFNWYADQEIVLMSSYVPWYIEEARSLNLITSERISQTNYNFIDRIVEETTILKPRYSNASGTEESDGLFVAPFLPRLLPTKDSSGRILPPMPTGTEYRKSLVPIVNEDGTLSDPVTRGGSLLNTCEINIRRSDGIPLSKYGETSSPGVNPGVKVPKDIQLIVNTGLRFRDADLSPECLRYRDQDPTSGDVGRPGDVGQEGPQPDPGSFDFGRRSGPRGRFEDTGFIEIVDEDELDNPLKPRKRKRGQ